MHKFILSKKADDDIEEIYDDGLIKFGKAQAIKHLEDLNRIFFLLSESPKIGRNREEIRANVLSFPFGSHIIFYRIFKSHMRILGVLYGGRDLVNFLKY